MRITHVNGRPVRSLADIGEAAGPCARVQLTLANDAAGTPAASELGDEPSSPRQDGRHRHRHQHRRRPHHRDGANVDRPTAAVNELIDELHALRSSTEPSSPAAASIVHSPKTAHVVSDGSCDEGGHHRRRRRRRSSGSGDDPAAVRMRSPLTSAALQSRSVPPVTPLSPMDRPRAEKLHRTVPAQSGAAREAPPAAGGGVPYTKMRGQEYGRPHDSKSSVTRTVGNSSFGSNRRPRAAQPSAGARSGSPATGGSPVRRKNSQGFATKQLLSEVKSLTKNPDRPPARRGAATRPVSTAPAPSISGYQTGTSSWSADQRSPTRK